MKSLSIIFIWLTLAAIAAAGAPTQPTLTRYSKLWINSVFTTPAEVVNVDVNPLEDYALGGISKLEDGYYAILLNRKKPDEKVVIYPGQKNEFEVLEVEWPTDSWKDAVVPVKTGSKTGVVKFEDKLLTLKAAPAQAPQAKGQPPTNPAVKPPTSSGQPAVRTPRPRVVVPKK